jgi:hypothetical protein
MSEEHKRVKRLIFYDTDGRQAKLRIRLKYDNLGQSDFFRMIVTFYLNKDERVMSMIEEYKKLSGIRDRTQQRANKKLDKKAEEIERQFGLDPEEIESIFDLMEKEFPNL